MVLLRVPNKVLEEPTTTVSVFLFEELFTLLRLPFTVTFCNGLPLAVFDKEASS